MIKRFRRIFFLFFFFWTIRFQVITRACPNRIEIGNRNEENVPIFIYNCSSMCATDIPGSWYDKPCLGEFSNHVTAGILLHVVHFWHQTVNKTVMNRIKPWPYSTVPRSMEPRFVYGFKQTAPKRKPSNCSFGLMHTARCGFDGIPTVRFGAVRCGFIRIRESYGAVRCGFRML